MQKKSAFIIVIIFFTLGFLLINQNKNLSRPPLIKGGEIQIPSDKADFGGYSNIQYVRIARQNIKVELALTPEAQTQGLSGRSGIHDNEGMFFVFSRPGKYPFWMKDMNFQIDIIWIGEDREIIYIQKDARPGSYPEIYGPADSAKNTKYVLEVVAGFSEKNNLQIGDQVEFLFSS